jgi:hypothetical protein
MKTFFVFGDYGYVNEQALFSGTESEARLFAEDYAENHDKFTCIEVAYFADDGEYVDVLRLFPEDMLGEEPSWDVYSD